MITLERGQRPARARTSRLRELSVSAFLAKGEEYRQKARVFTTAAIEFSERQLPVHPYLMGLILGNGNLSQADRLEGGSGSIALAIRDDSVITAAERHGLRFNSKEWRNGCWRIYLIGNMADWLRRSDLAGSRSHDKLVPTPYLTGSIEQRKWLLAGLIDTDGTFEEFSTTSSQLADDFVDLVHSIGGVAAKRERITTCNGNSFDSFRCHYSTTEIEIPVQCARKSRGARDMLWKNPRNTSFALHEAGRADVHGLVLDSPSNWYVTNDWLVTAGVPWAGGE